jgi:exopolysaccharide production protein ExoZ
MRIRQGETLVSIQALRAIAALLVVFAHIYPELLVFGPTTFPNFFLGAIGVDLFFVISGFIMVYASEPLFGRLSSTPVFLARRIIRIVPLYWIASTLFLFYLRWKAQGNPMPDLPLHSIIRSYFFMSANRPGIGFFPMLSAGWTLYYEMFFYFVFAGAIMLPRPWAVVAVTAVFCFFIFVVHNWDTFLFEFVFGMIIALAYRAGLRLPLWVCVSLILIAIPLWVWIGLENLVTFERWQAWGGASAMVVSACALSRISLQLRWASKLGDASYSLYLFHGLVALAMFEAAGLIGINPQPYPWLYGAFYMALCIASAIMIYEIMERPLTKALNQKAKEAQAWLETAPFRAIPLDPALPPPPVDTAP